MKIDTLRELLDQEILFHQKEKHPKPDFKEGFVQALQHVKINRLPLLAEGEK